MSKIKWGAIVVDGRGKLGGHVFTKTRSGATMRTKVTPVNPQSTAQASARSRLGGNSQAWANLTEAQRIAWNVKATEITKTNIFGDSYSPTGKNYFTSVNNNLLLIGEPAIVDAPTNIELPFIVSMSLVATANTNSLAITVDFSGEKDNSTLVVESTAMFSAGKFNFDGSYRKIMHLAADDSPMSVVAGASYVAKFGNMTVGKKIAVRCYFVNQNTGQASPKFSATVIIA